MNRAVLLAGSVLATVAMLATPRAAVACDMVCVASENYEAMLKSYKRVLVGRVAHDPTERYPTTFIVKPIRVWKGGKKQITLVNASGMCGMTPRADRLYLVFASADPESLSMCSPVIGLWEQRAKVAVTRLDRARRFPPLSVPDEDLEP